MSETEADAYTVVELPAQPFVGITKGVTMTTMNEIADEIPGVLGWLGEHGYAPGGAPFLRYLVIDMEGTMVVQAGVPVTDPVEGGDRVEAGELPAGRYASTTHVGHSDGLYDATVGLLTWAGGADLTFDKPHHRTARCGPTGSSGTRPTRWSSRT